MYIGAIMTNNKVLEMSILRIRLAVFACLPAKNVENKIAVSVLPTKTITNTTTSKSKGKSGLPTKVMVVLAARVIVSPTKVRMIKSSAANSHHITSPIAVLAMSSCPSQLVGVLSTLAKEFISLQVLKAH